MARQEQIEAMERKAAGWRAYIEHMETDESIEEWTAAMERQVDMMNDEAWRLEDAAAVLRAQIALESPAFAGLAVASLPTMPAGPSNLGDPGVWHNGREYWAYELLDLYATWTASQAAA